LLQIDDTSLTHWASHLTLQQNESSEQMSPAQLSQVPVSLTPEVQIEWAHVVPPPPPPPPVHDWPQTDWTSPTQIESHELLQQNGSTAQIRAAQGSHDAVRLLPVEEIACAQPFPQTPQSIGHVDTLSLKLQTPSPQTAQSIGHVDALSLKLQKPSPQGGQSLGHVDEVSLPAQTPSPHATLFEGQNSFT